MRLQWRHSGNEKSPLVPVGTRVNTFQASAPGRCGIVGNPSDIYGGVVVSCSLPVRATCRLTLGQTNGRPDDTRLWDAAMIRFPIQEPVDVHWQTDVPRSSGLSGSTALLAATLACVRATRGEANPLEDRTAFTELLRDIERNDANIVCGYQDAYMIVFGGLQRVDLAGKHPTQGGPPATLTPIDAPLPFLLITTGVERLSGSVHGPMVQRWVNGEKQVVDAMQRIGELGREGANALAKHDWETLARAMTENHQLVADLGGSGEPIDDLIHACKKHGAKAAKLAGAGLGGTVIALAEDPDELENRLKAEGYAKFLRPAIAPGLTLETPL